MKFTDGYWGLREGVRLFTPSSARDVQAGPSSLTVYAPCRPIRHRGDTLNAPQLTLTFSSPLEDVIRVHICHFKGGRRRGPDFELRTEAGLTPRIEKSEGAVTLASGNTAVRVSTGETWAVDFLFRGTRVTGSAKGSAGYVLDASGARYVREQLSLGVGELVYGLGERFTPFVKNGQVVETWNEDGGTSSEQAYKNIPFYLSSAGYGVLVAHPERVSFEIASEVVSRAQFSVPGEELEYFIIGGGVGEGRAAEVHRSLPADPPCRPHGPSGCG